jgi:transcriptional regulator with XRE-family HTH domain
MRRRGKARRSRSERPTAVTRRITSDREALDLRQADVARMMGISQQVLSAIERGAIKITLDLVEKILRIYERQLRLPNLM